MVALHMIGSIHAGAYALHGLHVSVPSVRSIGQQDEVVTNMSRDQILQLQ